VDVSGNDEPNICTLNSVRPISNARRKPLCCSLALYLDVNIVLFKLRMELVVSNVN